MGETRRAVPKAQQYVYRSVAVEIGAGRYARDRWILEPYFERDSLRRATEGKVVMLKPKHKPGDGPRQYGPTARYTPDNINREKGLYVLVRTETLRLGGPFYVVAKCRGRHCGGHLRRFSVHLWQTKDRMRGCNRCAAALRRVKRQAEVEAQRVAGLIVRRLHRPHRARSSTN